MLHVMLPYTPRLYRSLNNILVIYMGCFVDTKDRDMSDRQDDSDSNSIEECGSKCMSQGKITV